MLTPFFKKNRFFNKTRAILLSTAVFFQPLIANNIAKDSLLTVDCKTITESFVKKYDAEKMGWMKDFFEEIFLRESGAYTLYGSKPITAGIIYDLSDEEWNKRLEDTLNLCEEDEREELKKSVIEIDYTFNRSWRKWQEASANLPLQKFLLVDWPMPDEKIRTWFLVNIPETAFVLQKHYETFKRVWGKDFDPFQIVYEIQDTKSEFWRTVWNHHALTGLLHGYGERNSWMFYWENTHVEPYRKKMFVRELTGHAGLEKKTFEIPPLASFPQSGTDPVVENFKNDQAALEEIFKDEDFSEICLRGLLGENLEEIRKSKSKS